jgi:hypothetical protein
MDTPPTKPPQITLSGSDEPPKKYIRTFEGDMETFKKGGAPDLKPLTPKVPAPQQPPRPVPTPLPVENAPTAAADAISPKDAPLAPTPKPLNTPPPEPPLSVRFRETSTVLPPEPVMSKPLENSPLQTYSNDFSERVKERGASTATVLAAEQDARTAPPQSAPEVSRGNLIPIIAGVVLLLLGSAGAFIAYTHYTTDTAPIVLAPSIVAPISVDEKEELRGTTAAEIRQGIEQSLTRALAPNAVRHLYIASASTSNRSVFSALQLPAPDVVLRNIDASHSMAGIVQTNGLATPFFILGVTSYGDTFAGMLSWESRMSRDLEAFFPPYSTSVSLPIATTTATTTPKASGATKAATTTAPRAFIPGFRDEVVSNHDVRVYRDAEKRVVLIYGYWNPTTLVIARDIPAFIELLSRLATARAQN